LLGLFEALVTLSALRLPRGHLPAEGLRVGFSPTPILGRLPAIRLRRGVGAATVVISASPIVTKLPADVPKLHEDPPQVRLAVVAALPVGHAHNLTSVTGEVNVSRRTHYLVRVSWLTRACIAV
jgi:hypothetical protein